MSEVLTVKLPRFIFLVNATETDVSTLIINELSAGVLKETFGIPLSEVLVVVVVITIPDELSLGLLHPVMTTTKLKSIINNFTFIR